VNAPDPFELWLAGETHIKEQKLLAKLQQKAKKLAQKLEKENKQQQATEAERRLSASAAKAGGAGRLDKASASGAAVAAGGAGARGAAVNRRVSSNTTLAPAVNRRVSSNTILHSPQSIVTSSNWAVLRQRVACETPAFERPESSLSVGSPSDRLPVSMSQSLMNVFKFKKLWDEEDCVETDAHNPTLNWPECHGHVQPRKDSLTIPGRRRTSIMIQNPEQQARRLSPELRHRRNSVMIQNPEQQAWRSSPEPGRRRSSIMIQNPEQQSLGLK
jgi:hypothetical protein